MIKELSRYTLKFDGTPVREAPARPVAYFNYRKMEIKF